MIARDAPLPSLVKQPDEIDLFLYSAAVWNPHRIHYDRNYALTEGHSDLVVQGPLQGNWIVELVGSWAGPLSVVKRISYRHLSTAYVGELCTIDGKVVEVRQESADGVTVVCEASVRTPRGVSTRGRVEIWIPNARSADAS